MKAHVIVAISICVLPNNAFPITGRDNWQTISSSDEVNVIHPLFAGRFGPKGLFNACSTDEEFISKTPIQTCLSYKEISKNTDQGILKDYECRDYESKNVSISRTYTQVECVKYNHTGECLEYDSVTSVYPRALHLVVTDSNEESSNNLLFTKAYTVAACK